MRPVIGAPLILAAVALLVLVGIFSPYGKFNAGQEFFAPIESQYGMAGVRAQGNISIDEQRELTFKVQDIVADVEGVAQLYGNAKGSSMVLFGTDVSRDEISSFLIELYPSDQRDRGSAEIFEEIRQKTKS